MSNDTSKIIAEHNDIFRSQLWFPQFGIPEVQGKYMLSNGIYSLSPVDFMSIIGGVRNFNDFKQNNDPYGEHDFGKFSDNLHDVIWKIDYYDTDYKFGSADPSDPAQTRRVLTVMLACEY